MLHRNRSWMKTALSSILLLSMLCGIAWSQRRPMPNEEESEPKPAPRKKVKGPRAVGVIEIAPNGKARLVPIAILVGDKWFDAGVYMADPRPMALEPETVYEGEVAGNSAGLFTITGLATISNNFIGLGTWKPVGSEQPKKKVTLEAAMPTGSLTAEDDERPKLKRPKPADSEPKKDTPAPPATTTSPASPNAGAAPSPAADAAKKADNKPAEPPAPKPARSSEEDASRPRLRRGTSGVEQAEGIALPSAASDFATAPAKPGAPAAPPVNFKRIAAISDAGGPQPRSYVFHANAGEAADYKRKMIPLAQESLQKFISLRMKGVQAPAVTDQNSKLEIFDISSNNDPVLVLTVRIPAGQNAVPAPQAAAQGKLRTTAKTEPMKPGPAVEYDATIVARVSLSGELRKIFENVTDSTRLDAYPKMDLIDAVDANGDSVGELLFREQYDRGHAYVIYRVGLDKLWPMFEGEQKQF